LGRSIIVISIGEKHGTHPFTHLIFMKQLLQQTTNSTVFNKIYKAVIASKTGICTRCPWHGNENASRQQKSWKRKRRTFRQYKIYEP
jgi:hypothetical protein